MCLRFRSLNSTCRGAPDPPRGCSQRLGSCPEVVVVLCKPADRQAGSEFGAWPQSLQRRSSIDSLCFGAWGSEATPGPCNGFSDPGHMERSDPPGPLSKCSQVHPPKFYALVGGSANGVGSANIEVGPASHDVLIREPVLRALFSATYNNYSIIYLVHRTDCN